MIENFKIQEKGRGCPKGGGGFLSILFSFLLILSCTSNDNIAGGSSETGNAYVSGYVYNEDGSPAVNATVRFIPSGYIPSSGDANGYIAELKTDQNGLYKLGTQCAPGLYSIFASLNSTAGYTDSVSILRKTDQTAPPTTLKTTGTISGKVRLEGNIDNRSAFIVIHGSEYFTTPADTSGTFIISNVPEGRYTVRFFTLNDNYEIIDTSFVITSGTTCEVGTITLKTKEGQPVTGFTVIYDSLKQMCNLSWNPCDTSRITGYIIYRVRANGTMSVLSQPDEKTNTYTDILPIPLTHNETFNYSIASRGNEFDNGQRTPFTSISTSLNLVTCDTLSRGTPGFLQMILAETDTLGNVYCITTTDRTFKIFAPDLSVKISASLPALLPWNQLYRKNGVTILTQFERWGTRLMMINDSGLLADSFTIARHDNWIAIRDTVLYSPTVNGYETFSMSDGRYINTTDLYSVFNCPRTVPEIFTGKDSRMYIESSCYPDRLIAENLYSNSFSHLVIPAAGNPMKFEDAYRNGILMKSTYTISNNTYITANLLSPSGALIRRTQINLPPDVINSGRCSILPNGFIVTLSHGQLLRYTYR